MFGSFLGGLTKLAMNIVETPVAIVKDVATMGGALTDQDKPYTQQQLENCQEDWDAIKEGLTEKK
jgi:hypothetical protein